MKQDEVNIERCPGCHTGDFPDFDHFVEVNNITQGEVPAAFGAWLNIQTGWDGKIEKIET